MEKRTGMSNVRIAAFFMAFCIFFESTAFGFKAIYNGTNYRSYSKDIHEKATLQAGSIHLNDTPLLAAMKPDGGPDQPEVQSFSPIGVSDMVDPFSGDFSYNIPLMDVDGYPINIAYSAGVTVDQEASWVGLGWNLNPGVVNRSMRGVPDEYNGSEKITKEMNLKKNWTVGGSLSGDYELFGFGDITQNESTGQNDTSSFGLSLNVSLGINYNNYSGFSSSFGIGVNTITGINNTDAINAGLGVSGSSTGGASVSPSLGFQRTKPNKFAQTDAVTSGINLGSTLNSRGGLSNTSIGYTRTQRTTETATKSINGTNRSMSYTKSSSLPIRSTFNIGMSTYTPLISMPMSTAGGTFAFKLGGDIAGNDLSGELSGFYTAMWLKEKTKSERAFGYMNLQSGQNNSLAMLDFNRENDGVFTKNVPALPIPNLTYDIFSVSGQGVGGSYRPVRRDIGYVFDPEANSNSINGSLGLEANLGATFKGGIDISLTYSNSESGAWKDRGNEAASKMKFNNSSVFFREANEMAVDADPAHFNKIGGADPVRFDVKSYRKIENTLDDTKGNFYSENNYSKSGTDRRNQVVYTLSVAEVKAGLGIQNLHPNSFVATTSAYDHHIGQFTVLNVEGSRYVYGIPAYSIEQKNVSFAVGATISNNSLPTVDCSKGLVNYSPNVDNTTSNSRGIDNYYNAVTTPPFAHSYLLTTVLNADYVDADNIKGPSKGDLGGYLTFSYKKVNNYKWRNPVNVNQASYDEGFHTDNSDDKGHYISGTKELWYVKEIKSKNHIAVFHTSPREDAVSVNGENGGLNGSGARMERLDSIQLFSLPDFEADPINAKPLKTVHFRYDYSLCSQYSGNINNQGKLTLTEVFFTYQGSHKGRHTRYKFEYGQRFENGQVVDVVNPSYNIKEIDRWNNYKAQGTCSGDVSANPLKPSDFPYVGFDQDASNKSAIAWNLTTIKLPSGGKIEVDYESDDYAYVQHRRANQMFKIIGVQKVTSPNSSDIISSGTTPVSEDDNKNGYIYVELMPDSNSPSGYNENISAYVKPGERIYFRALMRFASGKHDFVPGYAIVSQEESDLAVVDIGSQKALRIKLKGETLLDNGNPDYNPIAVAAIQFGRIHLSKFLPPSSSNSVDENANLPGLLESLGGAFTSLQELFIGPNLPLWNQNIGNNLVIGNSWVRLQNPNKKKLGGGHRVKEIRMYDSWAEMTGSMDSYHYGQVYNYTHDDGTSSGVAAYEPQIGGDENPFRQPISADVKHLLAPDERNYRELPFGEQFFPSPRVGYAKVTIADLPRPGVKRTATGKVVHEFYTAKEFPTIASYTSIDMARFKLPIFAPFFSSMVDEMAASQGFVVENNDMHGKPKRQSVYAADQSEPITKVEYFYQSEPITLNGIGVQHLINTVTTIAKNGTIGQSTIGLTYDAVADFRKSTSNTISGSLGLNLNFTLPFVLVPTITGSASYERTAFRSATFTKVIERFGIQSKTVATDLGSKVETNNLAYDAETGTILLTQTTTNFNDKVYNFTYPAHWYYDQMGQAYRNIGNVANNLQFVNGGTAQVNSTRYSRGDEVAVKPSGSAPVFTAWVTEANSSGIRILLKDGSPLEGSVQYIKVLRSGRRNLQTTPVGTVALRNNPLSGIQGNVFEQVLQAGAVEYSDDWRTFCECFLNEESSHYTTNPFVLGTRGTWRPVASYVHLSGRTQTFENGNSNIRVDGMFTSFTPFYKLSGGQWNIDRQNWTYTSSVVEFSPFGQALETVDALSRYSSSMFGYNQTLPIAVAANTRYRQLGYDGFEDYDYDNCSDNHFRIGEGAEIVTTEAHTGRKSIRVTPGNNIVFSNTFAENCDETPCDLQLLIKVTEVDKGNFVQTSTLDVTGGQQPYSFDYQILEGNASVELSDDGNSLIITDGIEGTPNQTTIRILITDANGCQKIIEI